MRPAAEALCKKYRKCLRTTNTLQRRIQEIQHRDVTLLISPNTSLGYRRVGALCARTHEKCATGRQVRTDRSDEQEYGAVLPSYSLASNPWISRINTGPNSGLQIHTGLRPLFSIGVAFWSFLDFTLSGTASILLCALNCNISLHWCVC